ncbi:MAG: hypothetical protein JW808_06590 [Victivallales bacterium]|nr:hypothetical protein [Victivallales bacterium]
MKPKKIQVKNEGWEATHDLENKIPFCLRLGTDNSTEANAVVKINPGVTIGQLSETAAAPLKCTPHTAMDSSKTRVQTLSVIPFGQEPIIARTFEYMPHVLSISTNLRLPGKTETNSLEIDSMEIYADIAKFAVLEINPKSPPPQKLNWIDFSHNSPLYDSNRVFHSILLDDSRSNRIEINSGFDIWRWHKASPPQSSRFIAEPSKNGIRIRRLLLSSPETATIPPSAFQVSWHLSWIRLDKPEPSKMPTTAIQLDLPNDRCLHSRANRAKLRKLLRSTLKHAKNGQIFSIPGIEPSSCENPSHTGKNNMSACEHWDISEIFNFWFWGNRQLSQKGAKLIMSAPEKSPFRQFPSFMLMNEPLISIT